MSGKLTLLVVGRASLILCSIVSVRFATEVLGATQVGIVNLAVNVTALFSTLVAAVGLFFNRQVLEWLRDGRLLRNIKAFAVFLTGAALVTCASLSIVQWGRTAADTDSFEWLPLYAAASLLIATLNGSLLYVQNVMGLSMNYVLLSNLTSWGGVGFAISGCWTFGARPQYWLVGLLLGQTASLACSLVSVRAAAPRELATSKRDHPGDLHVGAVARFSWPLLVCTALYWLQRNSFGPLMAYFNDAHTLGLFSVSFSVGLLAMTAFDTLFKDYYSPVYFQAIAAGTTSQKVDAWNAYMSAFAPAVFSVFLFIAFFADQFLQLLVSEEFQGYGLIVALGALSQMIISLYSMYVLLASTFMDNRILLIPNMAGALVTLILLCALLPREPLVGAAISINLGLLATTALAARRLRRDYPVQFPRRRFALTVCLSLPLPLISHSSVFEPRSTLLTLAAVATGGIVVLTIQYFLARTWLQPMPTRPEHAD